MLLSVNVVITRLSFGDNRVKDAVGTSVNFADPSFVIRQSPVCHPQFVIISSRYNSASVITK